MFAGLKSTPVWDGSTMPFLAQFQSSHPKRKLSEYQPSLRGSSRGTFTVHVLPHTTPQSPGLSPMHSVTEKYLNRIALLPLETTHLQGFQNYDMGRDSRPIPALD